MRLRTANNHAKRPSRHRRLSVMTEIGWRRWYATFIPDIRETNAPNVILSNLLADGLRRGVRGKHIHVGRTFSYKVDPELLEMECLPDLVDVHKEKVRQIMDLLAQGKVVDLKLDGRVIARYYPNGRVESFDGPAFR